MSNSTKLLGARKASDFLAGSSPSQARQPVVQRILLADDDADTRDYVRLLLAQRGYEVEAVPDGAAALDAARARTPDLILFDVLTPGLDAFRVLEQLRTDERLKTSPIILLSTRAGENSRVEALEAGADDYLVKPFSGRELLAHVEAQLRRNRVRREAEEDLREREERYELVLAGADAAIWDWDVPQKRVNYSPRWKELRGFSEAEVSDREEEWSSRIHPDDFPRVIAAVQAHFEGRTPFFAEEYRVRHKDGGWIWIGDRGIAKRDAAGRVVRMAGSETDITERKQAEQSLAEVARQQQALYQLADQLHRAQSFDDVYNAALDAILGALQCDRASILLFDDAGTMRFVGWRGLSDKYRMLVEGHSPWAPDEKNAEPISVDDIAATEMSDALKAAIKEEGIAALTFIPLVSKGRLIGKFMSYFNAPHAFGNEEIEMNLSIARQLAFGIDRKKAELALRESEERFRAFFENSTLPLWEQDWSGAKAQLVEMAASGVTDIPAHLRDHPQTVGLCLSRVKLLETNQASLDLFRAPGKTALLERLDRLIASESWDVITDLLIAITHGQVHFRGAKLLRTFTGEKRYVIFDFIALPGHEESLEHVLVSLVDITEIKRAEEALKEADRRKDEFLAMLAHELRNPLAPIRNAAQILKLSGHEDAKQKWAREVIERQTQHLTRLVDDLLDVSRITRGKITLQRELLELSAIINRAVETSHPLIDARKHRLVVVLPSEPVRIEGDQTRLIQVVGNLLNNAAKYTDEGGLIQLEAIEEAGEAIIRVRDNGMGISPDVLPRVFDLFAQSDRALDRSQGGLGIGLTLVRSLVEMHGGRVEAKSEGPGHGSEFLVRLPVQAADSAGASALPCREHAKA